MSNFWDNPHDEFRYNTNLLNKGINSQPFFNAIAKELPPVFTRQTASKTIGNLMSPKTFSNLDALGQGPPVRVHLGSRIGYERESFIEWLKTRTRLW